MSLAVQIAGSIAILAGFALSQWSALNQKSAVYLLINALGSGLLAADAIAEQQ
jgi:hypothetical protein